MSRGSLQVPLDGGPYHLTAGAGGAMWVTLVHGGAIARVGPDGAVAQYPVGDGSRPSIITAGPDRALWFTCNGDDRISRLGSDGLLSSFELHSGSAPFGIVRGFDGALWFTEMGSGAIGRITVDGQISRWPAGGDSPSMITRGPDGALWYTLNRSSAVGRMDGSGAVTVRELPTRSAGPVGIAATHDDAVWFTEILADKLGRIPMNEAIQEIELAGKPHTVTPDPADGVWVSLWGADQIAKVTADGEITTFDLPPGSEPHGLAFDTGGALWVALESGFVIRLGV